MLRLQTQSRMLSVRHATFSLGRAIQKIPGIKLNSRLISQDLQHTSRRRLENLRRLGQFAARLIQHPVVVVPVSQLDLLVVRVDARTDRGRLREVKWRPGHRLQLSGRDQSRIHRSEF